MSQRKVMQSSVQSAALANLSYMQHHNPSRQTVHQLSSASKAAPPSQKHLVLNQKQIVTRRPERNSQGMAESTWGHESGTDSAAARSRQNSA